MPRYENTPLSADYKDVLRRREIANALAERSFMPPGSEMVSGRVIPNWGRGMGNIGRAFVSDYTSKKADEKEKEISGKYDEESAASMQRIMDTLQGGSPRQAAMDATVDPYLRGNRSTQSVIDAMIKADAVKNRGGGNPYYKPIYDKEGNIYSFDARSANVAPVSSDGRQLSDPRYATSSRRNIKSAEQMGTGTAEAITDPVTEYNKAIAGREAEKVITKPQIEAGLASVEAKTGMLDEAIDKAIDESGAFTAGFLGSATSWAPGTPAYDLGNTLSTIKANIGFDKLREMRDNSPTGGALGQVSERENTLLQQVWSSLEQGQSPGQLKENLEKVRKQTKESWDRVKAAYKKDYGVEYGSEGSAPAAQSGAFNDEEKERRYQEWKASQ